MEVMDLSSDPQMVQSSHEGQGAPMDGRVLRMGQVSPMRVISPAWKEAQPDGASCCLLGHLHVKGQAEKMSKSLKNFITIKVSP